MAQEGSSHLKEHGADLVMRMVIDDVCQCVLDAVKKGDNDTCEKALAKRKDSHHQSECGVGTTNTTVVVRMASGDTCQCVQNACKKNGCGTCKQDQPKCNILPKDNCENASLQTTNMNGSIDIMIQCPTNELNTKCEICSRAVNRCRHEDQKLHGVLKHYENDIKDLLKEKRANKCKRIKQNLVEACTEKNLKRVQELMAQLDSETFDSIEKSENNSPETCLCTSKQEDKNCSNEVTDENRNTLLHIAARNGADDIVEHLLERGYSYKSENAKKQVPIHLAAKNGYSGIVEKLLKVNIKSISAFDVNWRTSLHFAASAGQVAVMELLLNKRSEINATHNCFRSSFLLLCRAAIRCGCCDQHEVVDPLFSRDIHGHTPLHVACINGEVGIVEWLFNDAITKKYITKDDIEQMVTQLDVQRNTCLHLAVVGGKKKIVDLICLLKAAKPDAYNMEHLSALHMAVKRGHVEIVHILLDKMKRDKAIKQYGDPLCKKKFKDYETDIIELAAGKNVTEDTNFKEALFWAAERGNIKSIEALLQYTEVNVENLGKITDEHGNTWQHVPKMEEHLKFVKALQKHVDENFKNVTDKHGNTLLHIAAREGHQDLVKYLLKKCFSCECRNHNEQIPLHLAVLRGNDAVVEILLEKNEETFHCVDSSKSTVLHFAASRGHEQVVCTLLKFYKRSAQSFAQNGDPVTSGSESSKLPRSLKTTEHLEVPKTSDLPGTSQSTGSSQAPAQPDQQTVNMQKNMVDMEDINGNTCLHVAVMNNHEVIVDKLMKIASSTLNKLNTTGMSPLHLATVNGNANIVKVLLNNNADCEVENKDRATPLHIASENDHTKIIELLLETDKTKTLITKIDKNGRTACVLAAEKGKRNALETFLKNGSNNTSDKHGNTPLHIAAKKNYREVLQYLLNGKNVIQQKNKHGQIPLHIAAQQGHLGIVEDLVKYEMTSIYACDNKFSTPLHLAASVGHNKVVNYLLRLGADEAKCDVDKLTPLDRALESGSVKTIKCFLKVRPPNTEILRKCLLTAAEKNQANVVHLLLNSEHSKTIGKSHISKTLFLAINKNSKQAVREIINSNNLTIVFEPCELRVKAESILCCIQHNRIIDTPMRNLIEKMPDVAEEVLELCQNDAQQETQERLRQNLLHGLKWPDYEGKSCCNLLSKVLLLRKTAWAYKNNHPLMIMVREKHYNLLRHQLVTSVVKKKWNRLGSWFFWFRFVSYLFFVVFVTGFVESTYAPYTHDASCTELDNNGYKQGRPARICRRGTKYCAIFNLVCEGFERLFAVRSSGYQFGNILELLTLSFSLVLIHNFEECQIETGYRLDWQWNLGTAAVLMAWVNLVINAQDHPKFGVYGVLVQRLTGSFAKFFIVYMMFIIGFALAFRANMQDQTDFETFWKAMVKTTAMMIGEFTFDEHFTNGKVPYSILGHIILLVFMIWMSIFIMNLLIGLTVDKVTDVQKQANDTGLTLMVELVLDLEKHLCKCLIDWLYDDGWCKKLRKFYNWIKSVILLMCGKPQRKEPDKPEDMSQEAQFNMIKHIKQEVTQKKHRDTDNKEHTILKVDTGIPEHLTKRRKADTIILEEFIKTHESMPEVGTN